MKSIKRILFPVFLLTMACVEVDEPVIKDETSVELKLSAEIAKTKVNASDMGKFMWSVGDAISINTDKGWKEFKYNGNVASPSVEFSAMVEQGTEIQDVAVYPSSKDGYVLSENRIQLDLPAECQWLSSSFHVPMIAPVISGRPLLFNHLTGLIRVLYKNVSSDVTSFVLESEIEPLTGEFVADMSTQSPVLVPCGNVGKKFTYTFSNTETADSMAFYIPLPVSTYSKLTMYLANSDGEVFETRKQISNIKVTRAELLQTPDFHAGAPGIVTIDVEEVAAEITYKNLDIEYSATFVKNSSVSSKFTVSAGTVDAERLVNDYNDVKGTDYVLLPQSSYTVEKLMFSADSSSASSKIHLSRTGLTSDVEYLLPLSLVASSTSDVKLSDNVKYIKVTNPKYCYKECDRSAWTIAFTNSEDRNDNYWAKNIFDGSINSGWATYWNASMQTPLNPETDDFRYPDEGTSYPDGKITYTSGRLANVQITVPYPCCDAVRKYDKVSLVIDMKDRIRLYSIGVGKRPDNGSLDLKDLDVYVEDEFFFETANSYEAGTQEYKDAIANYETLSKGNSWRKILSWKDIPKGDKVNGLPATYHQLDSSVIGTPESEGRYLLLKFPSSYRPSDNCIEIAELYAKRLISVDGESVGL